MTTKHTPGPWNVWPWENESVARLCVGPGNAGEAVCTFFDGDLEELPNADANARLIASSPCLLDALCQWANAEKTNDAQEMENARTARNAAIAKATGAADQ